MISQASVTTENNETKEGEDVFKNLRKIDDPWEILMMRAEGLHAHGYQAQACEMAVRLALDMLKNPPDFITDAPPISFKGKKKRVCAASHHITQTASVTLTHCAFICTVLRNAFLNTKFACVFSSIFRRLDDGQNVEMLNQYHRRPSLF